MTAFTEKGRAMLADIAGRYGVSEDAVATLAQAVQSGGGNQAQFSHPDLGGMGQWSRGGMTMVGDMFNHGLKATVDGICAELSGNLSEGGIFAQVSRPGPSSHQSQQQSSGGSWGGMGSSFSVSGSSAWPDWLGAPSAVGSQNDLRYAVFPQTRRLAIDHAGRLSVYDTGDHAIRGFSQQQSGDQSLTFTSQHGLVRVADLPKVDAETPADSAPTGGPAASEDMPGARPGQPVPDPSPADTGTRQQEIAAEASSSTPPPAAAPASPPPGASSATPDSASASRAPAPDADSIFTSIERLADLHGRGILTDTEYEAKKADLLSRL